MTDQLLPCPFCGGSVVDVSMPQMCDTGYQVCCNDPDCLGAGPFKRERQEAIETWNTRTEGGG